MTSRHKNCIDFSGLNLKIQLSKTLIMCYSLLLKNGTFLYRYMIPRYTDVEQFFSINSEDGMIITTRPLDRETQAWHNISVSATEIGKNEKTFILKLVF